MPWRNFFRLPALDDLERWQDAALRSPHFDQCFRKHDASVGLLSQLGELVNKAPVVGKGEWRQVQPRLQFRQVLAPGLWPLGILRPDVGVDASRLPNGCQQWRGRLCVGRQGKTGITQVTPLHREAEPVGMAAPLANDR